MSEYNAESGQQGGAGGQPTQPASSPAGVQPTSPVGSDTLAVALKEIEGLKATVRTLQSGHDRGVAKVQKQVDGLQEQIARYEEYRARGLAPAAAVREMELDALLESRRQAPVAGGQERGNGIPAPAPDGQTEQLITLLGLQPNDPDVTRLLREGKANADNLASLALSRKVQSQPAAQPNPAQQMPVGTGASTAGELEASYRKEVATIRRGDVQGMMSLKLKYREAAKRSGQKEGPWN